MAKKTRKTKKPSSKRFHLVYLYRGVDISIISRPLKTYDELLAAAREKFRTEGAYKEGEDNLFYLVTANNKLPEMGEFTSSELEDEDPVENDGFCNDCMVEHLDGVCPHKKKQELNNTLGKEYRAGTAK